MNAKADPQAQALALLRAQLAPLEAKHLAPVEQAIIRRMIKRALELKPVFAYLWSPARIRPVLRTADRVSFWNTTIEDDPTFMGYSLAEFAAELEAERARALRFMIGTAAFECGRADDHRKARAALPGLLDDLGKQAQALARTLERIAHHCERGLLTPPANLSNMQTMEAMVDALSPITRKRLKDFTEAEYFGQSRKRHTLLEFVKQWERHVIEEWDATFSLLEPLKLPPALLATLAEIVMDCPRPNGFEQRIYEIRNGPSSKRGKAPHTRIDLPENREV